MKSDPIQFSEIEIYLKIEGKTTNVIPNVVEFMFGCGNLPEGCL